MSLYLNVQIKRRSGRVVKEFSLDGGQNIELVMFWIWRDLFLTMLSTGKAAHREAIPDMLAEIDEVLGWRATERILYGGKHSKVLMHPLLSHI
jgi:hypothetical protein